MASLPVKLRTLQFVAQHESIANDQLYCALKKEYPHDKYVSAQGIDECLFSLTAGGLIEATEVKLNELGQLIQSYKITSYGMSKMKYINE